MSRRPCATLALLIAAAVSGYAQAPPVIDSIHAFMPGYDYPGTAGVTAGQQGIELRIAGNNFPVDQPSASVPGSDFPSDGVNVNQVTWTSQTGLVTTLTAYPNYSPTEVRVFVPADLIDTPGNVQIRVAGSAPAIFRVNPQMQVRALDPGTVGVAYSGPLFTGGTPPFSDDTGYPPGYTFDGQTGNLVSLPSTTPVAGTFPFSGYFGDPWGSSISGDWTLVVAPPVTITSPTALPGATFGVSYSLAFSASGGVGPYTYGIVNLPSGSPSLLPAGITLSTTGTLSGTPAAIGSFPINVRATDSEGRMSTREYTLIVSPPPLAITTVSPLPNGTAGAAYNLAFAASGAMTPLTWNLTQGALPPGLSLSQGGVLSGIPQQSGTAMFTVRAVSAPLAQMTQTASAAFQLTINPAPLQVLTTLLPSGTETLAYSVQLAATGGTPGYSWSIVSGALPAGLALNSAGRVFGTPQRPETAFFTAQVTDSIGRTATRPLIIRIDRYVPPLEITTGALPEATRQTPYSAAIAATGGEPPYTWSITGLPAGLSPHTNGSITGTPGEVGTYRIAVSVTDSAGRAAEAQFSLVVKPAPLTITTASPLAEAKVGAPISQAFTATGGVPPYRWGMGSGSIPAGTSFQGGILGGTPLSPGSFSFSVSVTDSRGTAVAKGFTLTVSAPLTISTTSLPAGHAGQPYSASLGAAGGEPPYRWTVGGLAAGLSGSDTGVIAGTPAAAGSSTVAVEVTDARGARASASFDLVIAGPVLRITTASPLANATAGQLYSAGFAAEGGTPPYRWAAVAGYAGGLTLSPAGELSGTPMDPGEYTVYVQVADDRRETATAAFSFRVGGPALAIATSSLPAGTTGSSYSAGLAATGNSGAVSWSVTGLPEGLSADAGGTISGTPRTPGAFQVAVSVTDAAGRTAARTLALVVGLPALPGISFGLPPTADPARQPAVQLGLEGVYPVPIAGRVILTFSADSGGDDPTVVFSNGSRSVDFNIPAGSNLATFAIPNAALQTGTVAGTIMLSAVLQAGGSDITPSPAPSRTIRINRMPPVITRVAVTRTATGFDVNVTGYSTTREVAQAIFRFNPAAGATLQTGETAVAVDAAFSRWYTDLASRNFGSQFTFTQTFNIQGQAADIASITVTLVNSSGRSDPATANLP